MPHLDEFQVPVDGLDERKVVDADHTERGGDAMPAHHLDQYVTAGAARGLGCWIHRLLLMFR